MAGSSGCRHLQPPPLGFEKDPDEEARILDKLRAAEPELLVVGLGESQQECGCMSARSAACEGRLVCRSHDRLYRG